jgi:hypothetical protein
VLMLLGRRQITWRISRCLFRDRECGGEKARGVRNERSRGVCCH